MVQRIKIRNERRIHALLDVTCPHPDALALSLHSYGVDNFLRNRPVIGIASPDVLILHHTRKHIAAHDITCTEKIIKL